MRRADAFQPSSRASSEHIISIQRRIYAQSLNHISSLGLFPANICPPAKRPCVLARAGVSHCTPPKFVWYEACWRVSAFLKGLIKAHHIYIQKRRIYAQSLNYILSLGLFPANICPLAKRPCVLARASVSHCSPPKFVRYEACWRVLTFLKGLIRALYILLRSLYA